MGQLTREREADFLADLTALSRKHGIVVTGCGCCGSPSLVEAGSDDYAVDGHYSTDTDSRLDFDWVTSQPPPPPTP
jgi:hypothetical protein